MPRPPSLLTLARRALRGEAALPRAATVLVATSGGPDSIALLHVIATLAPELGLRVVAHGVDHGLRPEAARELDLAEALAARLGVPFGRSRVVVDAGANVHARARTARYRALASAAVAANACAIATAHHADDRAETFLLRLLRGATATGLAVLPPRAPLPRSLAREAARGAELELVRPLLRARRADVLAHLARHELASAEDPSNDDPRYARARVRRELLPLLASLGPGIVGHLEALADELVAIRRERGETPSELPRATRRAIAALLATDELDGAPPVGPGAEVWLPGGLVVSRPRARDAAGAEIAARRPRAPAPTTRKDTANAGSSARQTPARAEGTGIACPAPVRTDVEPHGPAVGDRRARGRRP